MDAERWRQIDDVLQSVLDRAPEERDPFLRRACAGDATLEREVRSLLTSAEQADGFLENPAMNVAAKAIALGGKDEKNGNEEAPVSAGSLVGQTVSHYRIVGKLGAGGMGVVYKAEDVRLRRFVALKFLPAARMSDPDRKRRFVQEARTASALNHPHIVTIYDIGQATFESRPADFIAMEFVSGKALAQLIPRKGLRLGDAVKYAVDVADALAAAHAAGVVHRDLKPANVMVDDNACAKVLDFGLAKLTERGGSFDFEGSVISEPLTTEDGMILGTVSYMSPEQAMGKSVDARSDIFSFGALLYEMVTGRRAFAGDSAAVVISAILRDEPKPAMKMVPGIPRELERIVTRCLQKDPNGRYQHAGDLKIDLQHAMEEPEETRERPRLGRWPWLSAHLPWITAAAGVLIAIAASASALYFHAGNSSIRETRLDIITPPSNSPNSFALSPDGRKIVYVATSDGASRLWLRPLDSLSAQPLAGTENAINPFWSPDGQSVGFFADLKLKRIDASVGQPQLLAEVTGTGAQGTWAGDGTILFNRTNATEPLELVSAAGGPTVALTRLATGEVVHRSPRALPDGRKFFFVSIGAAPAIWLGSLADRGKALEPLRITSFVPATDSPPEYLAPGWLARVRGNVLVAQRFQTQGGQISGDPVIVAQGVALDSVTGSGAFSVAASGPQSPYPTIAWRNASGNRRQLIWFNRSGQNVGTFGAPEEANLQYVEISPDGRRVAVARGPAGSRDIWMQEGARTTRFTFDPVDVNPVWSPDGASVVFSSNRKGAFDLYRKPADGSGSEELLLQSAETKRPNSWSPDGRFLLYNSAQNNGDLMVLPMTEDQKTRQRKPFPFISTPFNEQSGAFSPDGKWVAYQSNESGRNEIYVRPFPGPGPQWQVSTGGGISARWRKDGKELYYIGPDYKLRAVAASTQGGTFVPGTPEALFQTHIPQVGGARPQYDVARDGRFLIDTELQDTPADPIHLLLNWQPPAK